MRTRAIEFAILLLVALGAGPVAAKMWQWSTTSATNASADPSINWAEDMAPSAVNDSARAMMAVLAAWRNDISAVNTSGGTASAYTLTTSEGVSSVPTNGQMISFVAHLGNNSSATLQVDGGTVYPIWLNGAALAASTLVAGTPYRVSFSASNSAWLLEAGYGSPYNVPLGGVVWTTLSTAPNSSFVSANGQCISNSTYSVYWAALGSPASGICAGGQFQVIDLRGRTIAGLDTLPGSIAAGRMTSSSTGCGTAFTTMGVVCANGLESWTLTSAQMPSHYHSASISDPGHTHSVSGVIIAGGCCTNNTGGWNAGTNTSGSSTTGVRVNSSNGLDTTNSTGGGGAHPSVPPTMGLYPWVRVL